MKGGMILVLLVSVVLASCSPAANSVHTLDSAISTYQKEHRALSRGALAEASDGIESDSVRDSALALNLAPEPQGTSSNEGEARAEDRLTFNEALGKIGEHYKRDHWKGSWKEAFEPKYLCLYSLIAGGAIVANRNDRDIEREFERHHFAGNDLAQADTGLVIALPAFTAFYLIPFHPPGPEEQKFEDMAVFGELMAATAAATFPLKAIQRERPNGEDDDSFPSAHTSFAFATAAYIDDMYGKKYGWKARLPAYAVASFIGLSRIENEEHFASDVLSGMFIGILVEKLVYKWHYGEGGVSPHEKREASDFQVIPVTNGDETSIYFVKSF
jgi:hypothetical protein